MNKPTQDDVRAAYSIYREAIYRKIGGENVNVGLIWLHFCRLDEKVNGPTAHTGETQH